MSESTLGAVGAAAEGRLYHKINTLYQRDPATKHKTLLEGQYSQPEFAYLARCDWELTEKVDGTNIRVMIWPEGSVTFGGKTDEAQLPAKLVKKLEETFLVRPSIELAEAFPDGAILYGEGYGAKIQKTGEKYRPDQSFVLFDALIGGYWLQRSALEEVASRWELDLVPIVEIGPLGLMVDLCKAGFYSSWGEFPAEGLVARPVCPLLTRHRKRIITKLKTKDYRRTEQ